MKKRCFEIEFNVIKKVNDATYGFEINPADFLDLMYDAQKDDCFYLQPTDNGIKIMVEDQEIAEMLIWEKYEHECKQQEEADI